MKDTSNYSLEGTKTFSRITSGEKQTLDIDETGYGLDMVVTVFASATVTRLIFELEGSNIYTKYKHLFTTKGTNSTLSS